jgi:hypothetical protein
MVVTEKISLEEYLKDFMPSLDNFISKCPLKIKSTLVRESGNLYLEILDNSGKSIDGFNYVVHATQDKQSQIREIKEKLENFYPIIFKITEERYSSKEITALVDSKKYTLEDALELKRMVNTPKYKIIRAHHKYNELDCLDLNSNKMMKFKLKFKNYHILTATFLEKLRDNPTSMSQLFFDAFEFKYILG